MIKMQMDDGSFENRHIKRWVGKTTELGEVLSPLRTEFREMYEGSTVDITYRGEVEYKYDDWEIDI
jgi:hypothetical protein